MLGPDALAELEEELLATLRAWAQRHGVGAEGAEAATEPTEAAAEAVAAPLEAPFGGNQLVQVLGPVLALLGGGGFGALDRGGSSHGGREAAPAPAAPPGELEAGRPLPTQDPRYYVAWDCAGAHSIEGIWVGSGPQVWNALQRGVPGGQYAGSGARLRRYPSWPAAWNAWWREGRRTPSTAPQVHWA